MVFEWSLWYVFVLEPLYLLFVCVYVCLFLKKRTQNLFLSLLVFFPIVGYMHIYYMSLKDVRKCKLFWKGQLLQILTFYFDKFTNIFIFWRN